MPIFADPPKVGYYSNVPWAIEKRSSLCTYPESSVKIGPVNSETIGLQATVKTKVTSVHLIGLALWYVRGRLNIRSQCAGILQSTEGQWEEVGLQTCCEDWYVLRQTDVPGVCDNNRGSRSQTLTIVGIRRQVKLVSEICNRRLTVTIPMTAVLATWCRPCRARKCKQFAALTVGWPIWR